MIYGVILAGGRGERFWPLSRAARPKQLLRLISDKTMLQETIDRVTPLIPTERIIIVTNEEITDPILDEIDVLDKDNILSEPHGRNTCLAIGLAAEHLKKIDPEAIMVVLSADHIIKPQEKFLQIIRVGADLAADSNHLVTIGIEPTRPETGYGYIKLARPHKTVEGISIHEVDSFTEKPKPAVASEYYHGRQHLWNSGMFIWSVDAIINAISDCQPDMGEMLEEYRETIGSREESKARCKLYEESDAISIDFAVLENAENVLVIKGDMVWDDVGSWNAIERYKEKDNQNNVLVGDSRSYDSYEMTVYNDDAGIIVALGVSDLVIVKTEDIVFVAHKTKVNEVKKIIADMAEGEETKKYL